MYTVFNGKKDEEIGISTMDIPNTLLSSKRLYDIKQIQGREGNLNIFLGYNDLSIPVHFNFLDFDNLTLKWLNIKSFFKNIVDNKLFFSEFTDYFFKVKRVELIDTDRVESIGRFTAVFICEPFTYLDEGLQENLLNETNILINTFCESKPSYKIKGEGILTITTNDLSCTFNVAQEIIVDTEKELCYRKDYTFQNSSMKGKYKFMHLIPGENIIKCSPGFEISIIPNWRIE